MRVIGGYSVTKILVGKMGVDLGGGEAFVAQHLLYGTEVGTILYQFGGETMAQTVRRDIFLNAGLLYRLFDKLEDRYAREMMTP